MFTKLMVVLATVLVNTHSEDVNSLSVAKPDESRKCPDLPMEVHRKIYSYTQNTTAFKNLAFQDSVNFFNELIAWEAPPDIQDSFSYSHWGYDYENRPVWSQKIGRQDWRSIVEQGKERIEILERYLLQSLVHVIRSQYVKGRFGCIGITLMFSLVAVDTPEEEVRSAVFIWDMDGFAIRQITYLPSVLVGVSYARKYGDLPGELVGIGIGINVNYATQFAVDIARPFLGNYFERIELYGNRNKWLPRFLQLFSIDILPLEYGGNNEKYKPVGVYG